MSICPLHDSGDIGGLAYLGDILVYQVGENRIQISNIRQVLLGQEMLLLVVVLERQLENASELGCVRTGAKTRVRTA